MGTLSTTLEQKKKKTEYVDLFYFFLKYWSLRYRSAGSWVIAVYKKQATDNKCDRCINKFDIFQKKSPECEAEANLPGLFAAN